MELEQEVFTADNGASPASVNDPHLACVLLLDASSSMQNGNAVGAMNNAICEFKKQCSQDDALRRGLDIAVVSFASDVNILQEFTPITEMQELIVDANGQTAMGAGLTVAMDMLERRKSEYKQIGIPYHRPWIFMITDGAPNDDYAAPFQKVNEMQKQKRLELWAVGVPGYEKAVLTSITKRVIELDANLNFAGLFEWLSTSLSTRSQSQPGESVKYDMLPEGSRVVPNDWGD